jgi:transcriptional regulator with XRE-family HTH domain
MSNSNLFGTLVRLMRGKRSLSQEEIGIKTGVSRATIDTWENGTAFPSPDLFNRLLAALEVSDDEARTLRQQFEAGSRMGLYPDAETSKVGVSHYYPATLASHEAIDDLQRQVKNIQSTIDGIARLAEERKSTDTDDKPTPLIEEIQGLKEKLTLLQATSQAITAPVTLPSREDMEVRLVSSTALDHLEEYRAEENKWFSLLGVFIGSILGIFVNVFTGGQMKAEAWILIVVFVLFVVLTGWTGLTYRRRGDRLRDRILGNKS